MSDDGIGVEEVDPSHLFDPFQQGQRRKWQGSGGTGLGLAIVRAIADAHGGGAAIHRSPGRGVTVTITLPYDGSVTGPSAASDPQPIVAL